MTLTCVEFEYNKQSVTPSEIDAYLQAIDHWVEEHRVDTSKNFRGFVPSDYAAIYRCLKAVFDSHLLCGNRFCEWGSGVGIGASLAGMIGYDSYGIEYDGELCIVANDICEQFDVPVTLVQGSFVPDGVEDLIDEAFAHQDGELSLHIEADTAYDDLDYEIKDFDLIFAFPWPTDVELTQNIFDRLAAPGAMMLAYFDRETLTLYRKN